MKTISKINKTDGEIQEREKLLRWFNKLLDKMPDGEHIIEISSPDRTLAQNKYYWVVLGIIANEVGTSPYEIHKYCKSEFLPSQEYFVLVKKKGISSTTDLTKEEMVSYIDKVILLAAEQGIVIPDIEEYKHSN